MNAHRPISPTVAASLPGLLPSAPDDAAGGRTYQPIGHDAPKHSEAGVNYRAACIAAQAVRGRAIHSIAHRLSLEAWERGERACPWPDPTPAEREAADNALRSLIAPLLSDEELVSLSRVQNKLLREAR